MLQYLYIHKVVISVSTSMYAESIVQHTICIISVCMSYDHGKTAWPLSMYVL